MRYLRSSPCAGLCASYLLLLSSFSIYLEEFINCWGVGNAPSWLFSHSPFPSVPFVSLNFVAPCLLAALTAVLCLGAQHGSLVNIVLTTIKIAVVGLVVLIGTRHVDTDNWHPFFPQGEGRHMHWLHDAHTPHQLLKAGCCTIR